MTEKKLTFDAIQVGDEIPGFSKEMTCLGNVIYQAATWDFARHHYDYKFAESLGLPAPFPDGAIYSAYLAKMITDWIGEAGEIKKFSFRFKTMTFIGDTVTCGGKVVDKYQKDGKSYIECALWVDNQKGQKVIDPASATIELD